jgi:multimeric flavodoxin WrbA
VKVVAFNGSPRKDGNTYELLSIVCRELEKEGITTEIVQLGNQKVKGCTACYKCFENKNRQCIINDFISDCIAKMDEADGILLGSPTYFCNVTAEMKALIDRAGMVSRANGDMFKRKVGAGVVAVRRAGAIPTFQALNTFFTFAQMIIPGSSYWNLGIGLNKKDALDDEEGIKTMQTLGQNMAWLLKKLAQ